MIKLYKCSQCKQCLSNNIACVDVQNFSICNGGKLSSFITSCPANKVCTTSDVICETLTTNVTAVCTDENCANCEASAGRFACLNETAYALCYGGKNPDLSSVRNCPEGNYCNIYNLSICTPIESSIPSCVPSVVSTTINLDSTTEWITDASDIITNSSNSVETLSSLTTESNLKSSTHTFQSTSPALDPNVVCAIQKSTGNYRLNDPSCNMYVYCYQLAGQYLGLIFYCEHYFDSATRNCVSLRPSNC